MDSRTLTNDSRSACDLTGERFKGQCESVLSTTQNSGLRVVLVLGCDVEGCGGSTVREGRVGPKYLGFLFLSQHVWAFHLPPISNIRPWYLFLLYLTVKRFYSRMYYSCSLHPSRILRIRSSGTTQPNKRKN